MRTRELLNQSQYAKSRGYSRQYITKCIQRGILERSVVIEDESGRLWIDPGTADQELHENRGWIANNPSGIAHGR
jgi:hypothetical protein